MPLIWIGRAGSGVGTFFATVVFGYGVYYRDANSLPPASVQELLYGVVFLVIGAVGVQSWSELVEKKVSHSSPEGKLKFGWHMPVLGFSFLFFLGFVLFEYFVRDSFVKAENDMYLIALTVIFFGGIGVGILGEAIFTSGTFDEKSIRFHTLLSGKKEGKWCNLVSVHYSLLSDSHVLAFKDGSKIKLSKMISGNGYVLDLLRGKGFSF